MPQVRKPEMAAAIETAALRLFADRGYAATTVAAIARRAGTAPANVYRYHHTKHELFAAVVPPELPQRHDALLDARVAALVAGAPDGPEARALLDFWLDHRLEVVVLLDRADGTPHRDHPARFVERLVALAVAALDGPPSPEHLALLRLVFDNTRRTLATVLGGPTDRVETIALIEGFWSYQLPGLDGLARWAATRPGPLSGGRSGSRRPRR